MSITKSIIAKPITVLISTILTLFIGGYFILGPGLALDIYPEIDIPTIFVSTTYTGAGPKEIEDSITKVLESQLASIEGVDKITSTSSEGSSQVQLAFKFGQDLTEATNEVRDSLDFVKDFLPDEADSPVIFKFSTSLIPIVYLAVKSSRSPEELRKYLIDNVQPSLEQVKGVSTTSIIGGRDKVVRVEVDRNRLNAYDLTLSEVRNAIISQNRQVGAGNVIEGTVKYLIRTTGEYTSIDEIKNTFIANRGYNANTALGQASNGTVIRLSDIATVYEGYEDQEENSLAYINGEPGIYIAIQKQSGSNSVTVADALLSELEKINKNLPTDIQLYTLVDTSEDIRETINTALSSAWQGGVLAMLVLFFFLRRIKPTLIIGISIPISIVITMLFMFFSGITLNIMSLTGLVLGIGMIVDSSIVVLENIFKYRERGTKLRPSILLGTQEMLAAITASTITTICVFLPILLLKNELDFIGAILQDFAFTVTIALLSSLVVATAIIPVLALVLDVSATKKKEKATSNIAKKTKPNILDRIDTWYLKMLKKALKNRKTTLNIAYGTFLLAIIGAIPVGLELLPATSSTTVAVDVQMPPGTPFDVTQDTVLQVYREAEQKIKGYKSLVYSVGGDGFFGGADTSKGQVMISLPPYEEQQDSDNDVKNKLRPLFDTIPGADFSFSAGFGPPSGGSATPIDLILKSDDLDALIATAYEVRDIMKIHVPEALEPQISINDGLPELRVVIDRKRAYNLGVNVSTIATEISTAIDGVTASKYKDNGDEYDIKLRLQPSDRQTINDLDGIFVKNAFGQKVAVSNFANLEKRTGPVSISREDKTRAVHITAALEKGAAVTTVGKDIMKALDQYLIKDEKVQINLAGDSEDIAKYINIFIVILLMSVALIFGVMASQFESLRGPFIIFLTIPLSFAGVVFFYLVANIPFGALTAVGILVLSGIVVNNGIVLVDYANLLRKRGYSLIAACLEAGKSRLRPILMTTLTTILGMVPLAFSSGQGTEITQAIGQTTVGGLSVSAFLTLFVVPVWYYIFNERKERRQLGITKQEHNYQTKTYLNSEMGKSDV